MLNGDFLTRPQLEALGFARLGRDVRIHTTCVLLGCSSIEIGDNVRIDPYCMLSAKETLRVGSHVHIAARVTLIGSAGIEIGDFVGVSHGACVFSASDDFAASALMGPQVPDEFRVVKSAPIVLAPFSCVGANSVVLPGSVLEEGAIVGALSLVKGTVSAWTVNAGVPARPVGARDRLKVLDAARRCRSEYEAKGG